MVRPRLSSENYSTADMDDRLSMLLRLASKARFCSNPHRCTVGETRPALAGCGMGDHADVAALSEWGDISDRGGAGATNRMKYAG